MNVRKRKLPRGQIQARVAYVAKKHKLSARSNKDSRTLVAKEAAPLIGGDFLKARAIVNWLVRTGNITRKAKIADVAA
jgi:hypothetical protein